MRHLPITFQPPTCPSRLPLNLLGQFAGFLAGKFLVIFCHLELLLPTWKSVRSQTFCFWRTISEVVATAAGSAAQVPLMKHLRSRSSVKRRDNGSRSQLPAAVSAAPNVAVLTILGARMLLRVWACRWWCLPDIWVRSSPFTSPALRTLS